MKLKTAAQRSFVIILILLLSIFIGYVYNNIGHEFDLKEHPRKYNEFVEKYSMEYGVPEYIIYGLILYESDFQSNHVSEDGRIGLMQLSPETFRQMLTITKENLESGILYDPETNIRYGVYLLSHLFTEYNRWNTVIATYLTDEMTVKDWMSDPANVDSNGNLTTIPSEDVATKTAEILGNIEMYQKLYYNN